MPTRKDAAWVKERLARYGLVQNDSGAYRKYPQLGKAVEKILDKPRLSSPDLEEQAYYQVTLDTYRTSNEATFLSHLLPLVIKTHRTIPAASAPPPGHVHNLSSSPTTAQGAPDEGSSVEQLQQLTKLTKDEGRVLYAFLFSGLIQTCDRDFSRNIPFPDDCLALDPEVNEAMMKDAAMTNPRPDRTFAVSPTKHQWPEGFVLPEKIQAMMEVMKASHHPFLVIEGKSADGSWEEAQNQACRAGTIMVHADRHLRAKVCMEDVFGVDLRTFVFSMTVDPHVVEIHVHWADVPDNRASRVDSAKYQRPTYHMNTVFSQALRGPDLGNYGKIRRPLHNIVDWGLGERYDKMEDLREAIVQYARAKGNKRQKTA